MSVSGKNSTVLLCLIEKIMYTITRGTVADLNVFLWHYFIPVSYLTLLADSIFDVKSQETYAGFWNFS